MEMTKFIPDNHTSNESLPVLITKNGKILMVHSFIGQNEFLAMPMPTQKSIKGIDAFTTYNALKLKDWNVYSGEITISN